VITGIIVPQIVKAAAHSDGGSRYVSKLLTLGASCSSPRQPS
jgi:putative peptidoglycan lipid II flippase